MGNCFSSCKSVDHWTPGESFLFDGANAVPKNVVHVDVSDEVREIPGTTFKDCKELESIILPPSLFSIGYSAFYGCCKLKRVEIPSSVISIGNEAFVGCIGLEAIDLPPGLSSIGNNAFTQCVSLVSVDLPQSLERLGGRIGSVFYQCSSLQEISIPSLITALPRSTFSCCSALEKVTLPSTMKKIKENAFASCASLKRIDLPRSIEQIHLTAFRQCAYLEIDEVDLPPSITTNGDNDPFCILQENPYHVSNLSHAKNSDIRLKQGPGPQMGFGGETQRGWGPELCGISLEQIKVIKKHPLYYRLGKDGKPNWTMNDFVKDVAKPMTDGTGICYALLHNQDKPLRVKVFVSHAWAESVQDFVEAIERSGEVGPFWVCSLCIYQNDDESKGVTIGQQVGVDHSCGPAATVLKCADIMLVIQSDGCDIYTRLWCVWEMLTAVKNGTRVRISANITPHDLYMGRTDNDTLVRRSMDPVDSNEAHCGLAADESTLRSIINSSDMPFNKLDKEIEKIMLAYLVTYPLDRIVYGKTTARDHIRKAIEAIFPRLLQNEKFKPFDVFLTDKLLSLPGYAFGERPVVMEAEDVNNYYYIHKNSIKNYDLDIFDEWLGDIHDETKLYSHLSTINNSSIRLKQGPGPKMGFGGRTQKGYGPEWCGVSLEQVKDIKKHRLYYRVGKDGRPNFTMKEFSKDTIEPATDGLGIGYALLHNQDEPLKVKIMVSHTWEEPIQEFVEAIERSGEVGPFWVCSLAIYQNNDELKGVTIQQQLGEDPNTGPFATVLKLPDLDCMMAVMTSGCNIYDRLWCVYEMFIAIQHKVKVQLCPHINPDDLYLGRTDKDICVLEAKDPVISIKARCGNPNNPTKNSDEIGIRKHIESTPGKFDSVNNTVEIIRLNYLVTYQLQLGCRKTTARDHIKDAIEVIVGRLPDNDKLISFDTFLSEILKSHPGFTSTTRPENVDDVYSVKDHFYYITDDDTSESIDVFERWIHTLRNGIQDIYQTSSLK